MAFGREGEHLHKESLAGSTQYDRTRPPRTSQVRLAYKATCASEAGHSADVEALVWMISSWADRKDTNQSHTLSETGKDSSPTSSDSRGAGRSEWRGRGRLAAKEKRPCYMDKSSRADDICNGCHKKASWPGLDHQVERTVAALRQRDFDTLVRAVNSWTELMADEPTSPPDTGQEYSWDSG